MCFEKDWFFWYIGAQRLHNGLTMVMQPIWRARCMTGAGLSWLIKVLMKRSDEREKLANYYCKLIKVLNVKEKS